MCFCFIMNEFICFSIVVYKVIVGVSLWMSCCIHYAINTYPIPFSINVVVYSSHLDSSNSCIYYPVPTLPALSIGRGRVLYS